MKVNLEAQFINIITDEVMTDDKVVGDQVVKGPPITLGFFAANALTAAFADERELSGDDKVTRFLLAVKMRRSKDGLPIDLTPEEVVLAKKCIGKAYPPIVVGQAYKFLNGDGE